MRHKSFAFSLFFILGVSTGLGSQNYKLSSGQKDFYFGHISYVETRDGGKEPVVIREGEAVPEPVILNLPLGPGDLIQVWDGPRCEIQFDNGTILRLDHHTRLKIETILAQSLSTGKKMSNLILQQGQIYVMFRKYSSQEIFQVITPRAAVKLGHNSVALIRLTVEAGTEVQVERGTASLLYGADKSHTDEKKIQAKQRGVVSAANKAELAEYEPVSDFKAWNESINANFKKLHEESILPKPLQKLPRAVFDFAQRYGNLNGEWLWHDIYGYVWRPYLNSLRYPWGWQPYFYGTWSSYNGELFWVPGEPWGWVPYHLGIWMWDKNKGWVWLPGSIFAPAWTAWDFFFGYYSWRPFYLFDWMSGFYNAWGYGFLWSNGGPSGGTSPVIQTIRKGQLKKKDAGTLPQPKEMKKVLQTAMTALRQGDQNLRDSVIEMTRRGVVVRKEDITSPKLPGKIVLLERFAKEHEGEFKSAKSPVAASTQEAAKGAWRAIDLNRAITKTKLLMVPSAGRSRVPEAATRGEILMRPDIMSAPRAASGFRFRDWNPDVRVAQRLGVDISYSSRTNEVSCPQLGFSSRHVTRSSRLTMSGLSGVSAGGSHSSRGSAPSSPSSGSHSAGSHSAGAGHSGGTSGGGTRQKN